jgi:hypothetical protein
MKTNVLHKRSVSDAATGFTRFPLVHEIQKCSQKAAPEPMILPISIRLTQYCLGIRNREQNSQTAAYADEELVHISDGQARLLALKQGGRIHGHGKVTVVPAISDQTVGHIGRFRRRHCDETAGINNNNSSGFGSEFDITELCTKWK